MTRGLTGMATWPSCVDSRARRLRKGRSSCPRAQRMATTPSPPTTSRAPPNRREGKMLRCTRGVGLMGPLPCPQGVLVAEQLPAVDGLDGQQPVEVLSGRYVND